MPKYAKSWPNPLLNLSSKHNFSHWVPGKFLDIFWLNPHHRPATDLPISSMKPRHQGKLHHMDQEDMDTSQLGDWGMDIDGYRWISTTSDDSWGISRSSSQLLKDLQVPQKWMKTMTRGDKLIGFPEFGSIHWIMVGMADEGVEALPNKNQAPHKMLLGSCLIFFGNLKNPAVWTTLSQLAWYFLQSVG